MSDEPRPTPEGVLIARAMTRLNVSARKIAPSAGITEARWRQIVNGYQSVGGQQIPVVAPAKTLARMAKAVGVSGAELEGAGRADAAKILREDLVAGDSSEEGDQYYHPDLGEITHPEDMELWDLRTFSQQDKIGLILRRREQREQARGSVQRRAAG